DNGSRWCPVKRLGAGCARGCDGDVSPHPSSDARSHLLGNRAAHERDIRVDVKQGDLDAALVGDDAATEPVARSVDRSECMSEKARSAGLRARERATIQQSCGAFHRALELGV